MKATAQSSLPAEHSPNAARYIEHLQSVGRVTFSTADAAQALGVSLVAARAALRRLKWAGKIATPMRGFCVIVPPEYRALGCRPAEQFVPELLGRLGEPYHVGLLSAAAYHGAAHQAPMVFQVVVATPRRPVQCGRVRIEFIADQHVASAAIILRNTQTGVLAVASVEVTAWELVAHAERCGFLDNVATVLLELSEKIDASKLAALSKQMPAAWLQRLGYLLDLVGAREVADKLHAELAKRRTFPVPLAVWAPAAGSTRDPRWQVLINTTVESDL